MLTNTIELNTASKFILKSFLGPFILTFFIALFVLIMQWLWLYIDDMVGKGIETHYIIELFIYASAHFVPMALPLAILLSSLMTMGNLGEQYELVAFKAAGVSLMKVMQPLIVFVFFLSISAFLFSNYVLPVANLKMNSLFYDIREKKPAVDIKPGRFYNEIEGFSIRIKEKRKKGNNEVLYGLMLYDHRERNGNRIVTIADSGMMQITPDKLYAVMTLHNGSSYVEQMDKDPSKPTFPFYRRYFKNTQIVLDLSEFKMSRTDEDLFKDNYQMLNITQLSDAMDTINKQFERKKIMHLVGLKESMVYFNPSYLNDFLPKDTSQAKNITNDSSQYKLNNLAFDKYIDTLSFFDKGRIYSNAISLARTVANRTNLYIEEKAGMFNYYIQHEIEWHRKFTLSIACLILFFIGAPLGAIIRKGGLGMPVVMSVIFFIFFHILSISGEKMTKEVVLPSWQGMWIATIVFLPMGIFFTWKAASDSGLFSIDNYIESLKKVVHLMSPKNWRKKNESFTSNL
ncbi:MAG: YjgP/YjgQ family permease [Flavobacteriales bacterium]|nr:YjgP/YjgQ family permease [Flavobacteriales bacterium]